jgi:hypothetical protein
MRTVADHEAWVRKAVAEAQDGDGESLNLVARFIWEHYEAKNALRQKGYGWTGLGLVETVNEVPSNHG